MGHLDAMQQMMNNFGMMTSTARWKVPGDR